MEARRKLFVREVEAVLPGAVSTLPLVQLVVLARAVCMLIQEYAAEYREHGCVRREFVLIIQGRRIIAGRREWKPDSCVDVEVPEVEAYSEGI